MILKPSSSWSHFCDSMYCITVFSSTAPTVAQKYPRAHRCWPRTACGGAGTLAQQRDDRPFRNCTSFAGANCGGTTTSMWIWSRNVTCYLSSGSECADTPLRPSAVAAILSRGMKGAGMMRLAVSLGLIWLVVAFVFSFVWMLNRDKRQHARARELERRRNDARLESLAKVREAAEQAIR